MANIKSAKKRIKQTKKRTVVNNRWRNQLKNAEKQLKDSLENGAEISVKEALSNLQKAADKSAKNGVIDKNKAARIKAKYARLVEKNS